mgnify:CR=1 FL=1
MQRLTDGGRRATKPARGSAGRGASAHDTRGSETAEAAWAHSVHAEPAGLAPDRWYFYRFTALGQRSPVGRTRTAPALDAPLAGTTLRAVLASCQRWEHGRYAAWAHVAQRDLDLVLFAGDYIYEYAAPPTSVRPHELPAARTLRSPGLRSEAPQVTTRLGHDSEVAR